MNSKYLRRRYLDRFLKKDLMDKILIISGPRQSGKTTLAKMLFSKHDYLNYYDTENRLYIDNKQWDRRQKYIIFDEFHIKKNWKRWLKALFEKEGIPPGIVVTGSAKLEAFRRTGDSLAGCFFSYRLHPFDLKEVCQFHNTGKKKESKEIILERLLNFGGFPEPYFKSNAVFYNRWRRSHTESILREDIRELQSIQSLTDFQTLLELLKMRVGSCINYESLSRDIGRDGKTIKHWLTILENFYVIFKFLPYYKKINKSLLKQPKYYFYDTGLIKDRGAAFENLVACSLLKENHFLEDCYGETRGLYYLKNKDQREIDFLVTKDHQPVAMIEAKLTDSFLSPHFKIFAKQLPSNIRKIQLVKDLKIETTFPGKYEIRKASHWLSTIDIKNDGS